MKNYFLTFYHILNTFLVDIFVVYLSDKEQKILCPIHSQKTTFTAVSFEMIYSSIKSIHITSHQKQKNFITCTKGYYQYNKEQISKVHVQKNFKEKENYKISQDQYDFFFYYKFLCLSHVSSLVNFEVESIIKFSNKYPCFLCMSTGLFNIQLFFLPLISRVLSFD